VNWYNSLGSQGLLNWNTAVDLCGQTGVGCNNAKPYQRVTKLYFSLSRSLFLEKCSKIENIQL